MTMERVRKAITFNAELKDESAWLWFELEQTGFPVRLGQTNGGEHEKKSRDLRRWPRRRWPLRFTSFGACNRLHFGLKIKNSVTTNLNRHINITAQ